MTTIWKHALTGGPGDIAAVPMPSGAKVLTCQIQGMSPTLWFECDPVAPVVTRQFTVIGTGWQIDREGLTWDYIATWQERDFVWHLFEIRAEL